VPTFDAELYLRLAGERGVLARSDRHRPPWEWPLATASRALVAIGAIDAGTAQAVLDDYLLAASLRGEDHAFHRSSGHRSPVGAPQVLAPRRVVACDTTIESSNGVLQLRYVSLGDESTTVSGTFRAPAPASGPRRRHGPIVAMGWGPGSSPPQVMLADDSGTTTAADFNGGGSDDEWSGRFEAVVPLDPGTAWIEVDGVRVVLAEAAQPAEAFVEPLPEEDPAVRHLWAMAWAPSHMHGPPDASPAVEALVAAGALAPGDPVIAAVTTVLRVVDQMHMPPGGPSPRLPEPWRTMVVRRRRPDGPTGIIAVAAVTPPFDGITVGVSVLESMPEGFEIEAEVVPDVSVHMPYEPVDVDAAQLTWRAVDDRGNHHLGRTSSWSGGDGRGWGEVVFWPAIDPKATRLDLLPTSKTERAVIRVPLSWRPEA
jgi:hypothetical protein